MDGCGKPCKEGESVLRSAGKCQLRKEDSRYNSLLTPSFNGTRRMFGITLDGGIHTGVAVPLRVVPSSTRLPSKRCPGVRFLSRVDREFGIFQRVAPTMRLLFEFPHETGLIRRFAGNVGNPLQTKHGNRPFCRDQEG